MNKKQLEIQLSKLDVLESKDIKWEQYQLEGNLAAEILIFARKDIEGKVIADFGCGNGLLGIGALLLGAKRVYFVDIDNKALDVAKKNAKGFRSSEFFNSNVADFDKRVDTVIMNPPFGVQKRKADKIFLTTAMRLSDCIYSVHKIESKNFIGKLAEESNFEVVSIIRHKFLLKKSYAFHKKKNYFVNIGIWILKRIK